MMSFKPSIDLQHKVLEIIEPIVKSSKITNAKRRLIKSYGKTNIYCELHVLREGEMGYSRLFRLLDTAGLKPKMTFEFDEHKISSL